MDCVERIESLTVEDFISVSVCLHYYYNFIFVYVLILNKDGCNVNLINGHSSCNIFFVNIKEYRRRTVNQLLITWTHITWNKSCVNLSTYYVGNVIVFGRGVKY